MTANRADARSLVHGHFNRLDSQLEGALATSRALFSSSTIKGNNMERALADKLGDLLADQFRVGTGQVMDSRGVHTGQLDVVLHNGSNTPFRAGSDAGLFFAESVIAVCEVKSRLDAAATRQMCASGALVKALEPQRSHDDLISWDVSLGKLARFYYHIPYICFSYESTLTPSAVLQSLTDAGDSEWRFQRGEGPFRIPSVDALFVLGQGAYLNRAHVEGSLDLRIVSRDRSEDLTSALGDWLFIPSKIPVPGQEPGPGVSVLWAFQVWLQVFSPWIVSHRAAVLRYYVDPNQVCDGGHPPLVSIEHRLNELLDKVEDPGTWT